MRLSASLFALRSPASNKVGIMQYLRPPLRLWPAIMGSLVLLLGCGGDDPTGPATLLSVRIEGAGPGSSSFRGVGASEQLRAIANFSDGSSQEVAAQAEWTSSDLSVATVSATGWFHAIGVGPSEICARYQGVKGCAVVTVRPPTAVARAETASTAGMNSGY